MNEQLPILKTAIPGPLSSELIKSYNKYVAKGVSHYTDVFVKKAHGAVVEDVDGNLFLDFAAGIGVVSIGHTQDEMVNAIKEQAGKYIHVSANILLYEPYLRVCEKLSQIAPVQDAKCILVNSGAEAVENAIKIARKYTGKSGVVTLSGSFHGRTMFALGMTSSVNPYKNGFGPFPGDIYQLPNPYTYRNNSGLSDEEFELSCANALDNMLKTSVTADMIACVIIEPVQGEGGFITISPTFLKRIQEICNNNNIVFIMDEIQTGFGRTGSMYATEQLGIQPDMITSAKGLAGGMPLSAVIGKSEIMDSVHAGGLGGTYSGNPVACAAALSVIEVMEKQNVPQKSKELGDYIKSRLLEFKEKYEIVGDVRGMGSMLAIELVKDKNSKEPEKDAVKKLIGEALQKGVIFIGAGMYGNVLRFLPPLVMSKEQAKFGMDVLDQALVSYTKGE